MSARAQNLLVAGAALFLAAAYVPSLNVPSWSGRLALLPALAAAGVGLVALRLRRGVDPSVAFAAAFLAWALVSALASPHGALAFIGLYGSGTGLLFLAGVVGAWALGRRVGAQGRRWLELALYAGLAANAVVAILEQSLDLGFVRLGLIADRSPGLMGNPVHLGSLSAGGAALLLWSEQTVPRVILAFGAGIALQLAGSRIALGVVLCAAVATTLSRRWKVAVTAVALGGGLAASLAITATGSGVATTERVGEATASGLQPRVEYWQTAGSAIADRPLFGSGPGTFGAATSPHRTADVAAAVGPDSLFVDAHNLIVELAVTVGLPGAVLLGAWFWTSTRQARGPLLGFALAILVTQLLQPLSVATTPLAFLALGAASPATIASSPRRSRLPTALAVVGVPAVVLSAGSLLAGDYFLRRADLDFELSDARAANRVLPWWAVSAEQLTEVHAFLAISTPDEAHWDQAVRWSREGTHREPWDPRLWSRHGELLLVRESPDEAAESFRAALIRNPQSFVALRGLALAELALGHEVEAVRLAREAIPRAWTPAQQQSVRDIIARVRGD